MGRNNYLRGSELVFGHLRKEVSFGDSSSWRGSKKKAKNVAEGVAGQRWPQDPHLQLHPDPARAGVKAGSQPHANVY